MHRELELKTGPNNSNGYSAAAKTGWLVDACMRSLRTGWLNFRMRAMLMAVASYQLWLHWRDPALHLARLFTDFNGHSLFPDQMQSA